VLTEASAETFVSLQGEDDIIQLSTESVDVILKLTHPRSVVLDLKGIQLLPGIIGDIDMMSFVSPVDSNVIHTRHLALDVFEA